MMIFCFLVQRAVFNCISRSSHFDRISCKNVEIIPWSSVTIVSLHWIEPNFLHCLPIPPFSLFLSVFHSSDSIKYRTQRTRWRRMASALWPTDWFRSRGILCTQISLWRSASHHPGLLKARKRQRGRWCTLTGGKRWKEESLKGHEEKNVSGNILEELEGWRGK